MEEQSNVLFIIFLSLMGAFFLYIIVAMILYASSKRFRKWSDENYKKNQEWMDEYKKRERQRRYEKRLRRIEKEIEKTGTYTPSRSWKYYAQKNGFYPEDEPVD